MKNKIVINYRLSDDGYPKDKLPLVNNKNCLSNFLNGVVHHIVYDKDPFKIIELNIFGDNTSRPTDEMVEGLIKDVNKALKRHDMNTTNFKSNYMKISQGSSASSFKYVLDYTLENYNDDELDTVIYFVENDYIHLPGFMKVLKEAFDELDASYVTLYDHPDKYIPAYKGGNPKIGDDGGELTKLYRTKSSHWKITDSTTLTFACNLTALNIDKDVIYPHIQGSYPTDYDMFGDLAKNGAALISSVPGYSTHGEVAWLAPPSSQWNYFLMWYSSTRIGELSHD